MWASVLSRLRCACTVALVPRSAEQILPGASITGASFHSLAQPSRPSPLANQCTKQALGHQTSLLQSPAVPLLSLVSGFKVKGRLKRRCKDCYFVMRQERLYVICKTHPRHKQMSMKKHERNTWILTDATQSKVRAW
uniref:Ribosomal protein n=1 Tax=Anopheles dirus TaxID=7168 RepID=A0A182NWS0_9DIPT